MINHTLKMAIFICSLVLAAAPASSMAVDVLGRKPRHVWGGPSSVVNEQAITKMIWAPGVDDGYVPQGITVAHGEARNPSVGQNGPRDFLLFSRWT